jgi:hypothetical protein
MIRHKTGFVLTAQELADLMSLTTVALWIRGEQILHANSLIKVPGGAEIDTHDLCIPVCQAQQEFASKFYEQAHTLMKLAGKSTLPTWYRLTDGPSKN